MEASAIALHERVGRLEAQLAALQGHLGAAELRIRVAEERAEARGHNAEQFSLHPGHSGPLQGLPAANGLIPVHFPATVEAFTEMTDEEYDTMLGAYHLTTLVPDKTWKFNRLKRFLTLG